MRELEDNARELEKRVDTSAVPRLFNSYEAGIENPPEPTLRDYWQALRRHWWLVVAIPVVCTTIMAIYLFRQPNIYDAEARVQVDLEGTAELNSTKKGVLPFDDRAYFNTQLEIITSPSLLLRVVKSLDLENNKAFAGSGLVTNVKPRPEADRNAEQNERKAGSSEDMLVSTSALPSAFGRQDLNESKRLAPYVKAIADSLSVKPVLKTRLPIKDTRLIEIGFEHTNPQIAADVANAVADALLLTNLERISEASSTKGKFLQDGIADLQSQIRSGEERLASYAKSHEILSLDEHQNTVVERLVGLNRQLMEAENERKLSEAAYRAGLAPGAAEAMAEGTAKEAVSAETALNELRRQRAQLMVEATEKWPEVKEVDKQIEVLEQQVDHSRNRATDVVRTNLETRYRQSLAREEALRSAFNLQRGETLTQNEAAVNYRIIQQEIDTNKNLLNGLLQRYKENQVSKAGTPNNIHVVDYAIAPDQPVNKERLGFVVLTLALSLPFGVGTALLLDYMNNTIRSTDDVEKVLNLPALAVIPSVGGLKQHRLVRASGVSKLLSANNNSHPELLINTDMRSPLAEAYRQLRTSMFLSATGATPKTILVTSSQASEGKTTTAVNLAVSLAQPSASVLIIDADMRRPRLHSVFGLENECGLSTILSDGLSEADMMASVKRHDATGLSVMTAGPEPPNPAELLGSEQMLRFLTHAESLFTHIIIDSPPIASLSDSTILSPMTDGVLFVVHGNKVSRDMVRHSQKLLNFVGARILGVVLNNVDLAAGITQYYPSKYLTP